MDSFCPRCGTQRTGAFRYCRNCGLDFETAPPVADESPVGPVPVAGMGPSIAAPAVVARRPWYRGRWGLVAAVVVVLGLALVGAFDPPSSPTANATTPGPTTGVTQGALATPPSVSTPQATPTPTLSLPTSAVAFAPIELSGRGDKVARFKIPVGEAAIAKITNRGTSNFVVWTLDASGDETDLLVNEIGNYRGTHAFDLFDGEHTVAFKIESNGRWTITIRPLEQARVWDTAGPLTGTGADVVQLRPPTSGLATSNVRHRGESNFAVWTYSDSGADLAVNEIGNYSGEILLPEGTFLMVVEADGDWSFSAP